MSSDSERTRAIFEVERAGRQLAQKAEERGALRRDYSREYQRERYRTDPEYREDKKARNRNRYRKIGTAERLLQSAYQRARRTGLDFNLPKSDVEHLWPADGRCPVLGFRMLLDVEPDRAPSLDRIDPALGYVPGNVRIISLRANRIKGDASPHEMLRVLAYLASPHPLKHTSADMRATYRGASPWDNAPAGNVVEITVRGKR